MNLVPFIFVMGFVKQLIYLQLFRQIHRLYESMSIENLHSACNLFQISSSNSERSGSDNFAQTVQWQSEDRARVKTLKVLEGQSLCSGDRIVGGEGDPCQIFVVHRHKLSNLDMMMYNMRPLCSKYL